MFEQTDVKRDDNGIGHILLKAIACIVLVLSFYASASATSPAPQSVVATLSTRGYSAPAPSRTPTLTPARSLPAQQAPYSALAPVSIPGQPVVDAYTVALYHFDAPSGNNQVIDSTGRYTATLNGAADVTTTTTLYGGVLQLGGPGTYVRTGHFDNYALDQGTIEAYIDFDSACNGTHFSMISAGPEYGSGSPVLLLGDPSGGLVFGIWVTDHWVYADSGINPCRYLTGASGFDFPYDPVRFHHVAGTWGPRGAEIWVDGVLHGVANTDPNSIYEPYPYKCNPQMQFGVQGRPPNPYAPYYCQTPVMYPTMAAFPPGDYTGGLPAYSTFQIGCDSTGQFCFNGMIDEVRISNIQRTFTLAVVPTNTPTPSLTPVYISGQYSVDGNTSELYHFNSAPAGQAFEEVSQQYSQLSGQAAIVPYGHFGSGLSLDGNGSYVNSPNLGSPFFVGTAEAWVKFSGSLSPPYQQIFGATQDNRNLVMSFGVSYGNNITLMVDGQSISIPQTPVTLSACWHHLAGTWGPRGLEIWMDGSLANSNPGFTGGVPANVLNWRVGCDFLGSCVNGRIDEVRVSNVQRTFTPFAYGPARSLRPVLPFANSPAGPGGFLNFLPKVEVEPGPTCPFGG